MNKYNKVIIRRALELYKTKLSETLRAQVDKFGNDLISKDLCSEIEKISIILGRLSEIIEFERKNSKIVCLALSYYVKYLKQRQDRIRLDFGSINIEFEENEEEITSAIKERTNVCPKDWDSEIEIDQTNFFV